MFAVLLAAAFVLLGSGVPRGDAAVATVPASPPAADLPVLAYYYIWFDPSSWNRAKSDYPVLGRYSSDEALVMRQHITWAKSAGIDGFIVSWKSTARLDARLARLVQIAEEEQFTLSIIYQGLDFYRRPLAVSRVAADLQSFADRYAAHPVFSTGSKPLVLLSGTWEYSAEAVRTITEPVRDRLLLLGTERDVAGVRRLAGVVDGNAYYWSSADPSRASTVSKLREMSAQVHAQGGFWLAPVAAGFDARTLGGRRVFEPQEGAHLREFWSAALESEPDAVGVISWNEFSENSHVEPSEARGDTVLRALSDITGAPGPSISGADSSEPEGRGSPWRALLVLGLLGLILPLSFRAVARRSREQALQAEADPGT